MDKVYVVGAGAMGSFFAARLSEAGTDVTLIDVDDNRLALIRANGIAIDDDRGARTVPVPAMRAEAAAASADLIILFTKGAHSAAAIASVAHLVGPQTCALTLQNGIGNAETIAAVIPRDRILMGITDIPCDLTGPNSVSSHGHGHIALGAFTSESCGSADAVVALLVGAGLDAAHDSDVQVAIWEKIAFNAAMNALCSVTTLPVGGLDNAPGRRVILSVTQEVVAVAHANDIAVDPARIATKIDHALANHVQHKPSMLQDRLASRPTEIETINGAVVRAGEAAGIDVTVNRTFTNLVRMIEIAR